MAQLSLRARTLGPWAGFEREIIRSSEHTGWAKYTGLRRVQLRKSPFLPPDPTRTYLLPEDLPLDDNELVELVVEREVTRVRTLHGGSALADDFERYYPVVAIRWLEFPMPRPYLDTDTFLSRLIVNWKDGEEDLLDKAMALQLLSCPRTALGPGGIGSQSFDLSGSARALDDLKRSIDLNLPVEFSRPNRRYEMDFLSSPEDLSALRRRVVAGDVEEASYNYLKMVDPSHHPLPQHVPTIIYHSHYHPISRNPDPDVIEFQLYALALRPVVSEQMLGKIEKVLGQLLEETDPAYAGYNIRFDQAALAKIAMALCRLYRKEHMEEEMLDRGRSWFKDLYRQFADYRLNYTRPGGSTRISSDVRVSYGHERQGPHDMEVLAEIHRGMNEVGLDYVSYAGLKKALRRKVTADQIRDSLTRLVQSGLVLAKENDNLFRPVRRTEVRFPERR